MPAEIYDFIHILFFALEQCLDATVIEIAHPSIDPMLY